MQEKIPRALTHIAVSQSGKRERDKESQCHLFYSPFPSRPYFFPPLQERYQVVYLLMVIQKRQANAPLTPWPSAFPYFSHFPIIVNHHTQNAFLTTSEKTYNAYIWNLSFTVWFIPIRKNSITQASSDWQHSDPMAYRHLQIDSALIQWHTGIVRLTALWSNGIQASSDWQRSDPMAYRHCQIDSTLAQWCWGSSGMAVIFQGDRATLFYNPVKM